MPPRIEKPEPITFNLMRGVSTKEKSVTAKLKSGVIEYPGMSPSELIIYFGQAGYSFYNLQTKKLELFYDITTGFCGVVCGTVCYIDDSDIRI